MSPAEPRNSRTKTPVEIRKHVAFRAPAKEDNTSRPFVGWLGHETSRAQLIACYGPTGSFERQGFVLCLRDSRYSRVIRQIPLSLAASRVIRRVPLWVAAKHGD